MLIQEDFEFASYIARSSGHILLHAHTHTHARTHAHTRTQEYEVSIPEDFDFANYMARASGHILSTLVEISVTDWVLLWVFFAGCYFIAAIAETVGGVFVTDGEVAAFPLELSASVTVVVVQASAAVCLKVSVSLPVSA